MRIFAILCLFITLSMSLIPMIAYEKDEKETTAAPVTEAETQPKTTEAESGASGSYTDEDIAVFSSSDNEVMNLKMRDYIIGVVAAEMPASYHDEALKAQAVAAYTYAVRAAQNEEASPTAALRGAALSTDSSVYQAYMSIDEMENRWGDSFDENYEKIAAAVDAAAGKIIVYDGEPIAAVFHSISSGKTESAANIWGGSYPYLVPVDSEGDTLSPKFTVTSIFTEKQFSQIAGEISGVKLGSDASKWIGDCALSDSGTVLSIEIGGIAVTGVQMREYFGLRSPAFTLTYDKDGSFTFKVTGYGHGVGMSQYGADYMARQGSTYEEIITHYYTGAEIAER